MTKRQAEVVKRALQIIGAGDPLVVRIGQKAYLVHLMHDSTREDFTELDAAERYIVAFTRRRRKES